MRTVGEVVQGAGEGMRFLSLNTTSWEGMRYEAFESLAQRAAQEMARGEPLLVILSKAARVHLYQVHNWEAKGLVRRPGVYAELMKESAKHVAKNAGEELAEEPDDDKATELMNRILSPSVLTPVPGFVVKCALKYNGGKVMVNVCSHQAVVPPNDQRGKDATQYKPGISPRGLQIPLVVGRVRSCAVAGKASNTLAEGKAVDVLVHPWVMEQINGEGPRGGPWRAEIAALAVSWVAKETKLPLFFALRWSPAGKPRPRGRRLGRLGALA